MMITTGINQEQQGINRLLYWIGQIGLWLTLFFVFIPFYPDMPRSGLDPSWVFGLNQALSQGLAFGKDMIFTFGPFVFLYTKTYHPSLFYLMIGSSFYLCCTYGGVLYAVTKNKPWYVLFFCWFVVLTAERDVLFYSYPLLCAAYCFNSMKQGQLFDSKGSYLSLIAVFFPFGLLFLIKSTFLIMGFPIILFTLILFMRERKWIQALTVLATSISSVLFFWIGSGQSILNVPHYFVSSTAIISGYSEAMSVTGSMRDIIFYVSASIMMLGLIVREHLPIQFKLFIFFSFSCYLFVAFKGGFVRHDAHALISASAILFGALILFLISGPRSVDRLEPRARRHYLVLFFAFLAYAGIYCNYLKPLDFVYHVKSVYLNAWEGLINNVTNPQWALKKYAEALASIEEERQFPKFKGTTDIYSYNQAYLLASNNHWNPRPVLQSYSAYTPLLAQKDKNHLLGKNAPDNLIFRVESIDNRMPSLEDGPSWPIFLSNYEPSDLKNDFLYMHKKSSGVAPLKLIKKGVYSLGEELLVPQSSKLIFTKIFIKPTVLGTIMNLLYKPSPLEISLHLENGTTRSYRMIPQMAQSEFLISPLIEKTDELNLLFGGIDYVTHKKVASFSIRPAFGAFQWNKSYTVLFEEMPDYPLTDVSKIVQFDSLEELPGDQPFSMASHCEGSIDTINDTLIPDASLVVGQLFKVEGWFAKSITPKPELPKSVFLVLRDNEGRQRIIKAKSKLRPDVGAYFKKSELNNSGFVAITPVSRFDGNYTLGLAYKEEGTIKLCPQFKIPLTFKPDKILDNLNDKKISMLKECHGVIDEVNGQTGTTSFATNKVLKVRGWLAKSIEPEASLPESVFIVLTNSEGNRIFIKTRQMLRPDVGNYFKKPLLENSGYISYADVSQIQGEYTLSLAYIEENQIQICPEFKIAGHFEQAIPKT